MNIPHNGGIHVIKRGGRGESVSELQEKLNQLGFELDVDGIFGDATYHAVVALQVIFGESVDGIVGPATHDLIARQLDGGWNLKAARNASG
jgi:peptidoglycan hydrolase-like protein with peptidoglycan-binding domain